jgi:trk system potassium uptake protein TrkA
LEANNILVAGGGLVGKTLADRLSRDGHDVTLIELDPLTARELSDTVDVRVIEGNAAKAPVLRAAGIEKASLVIAATESDLCNVVIGFLASQVFDTPRVVVRVRDTGYEEGFALASSGHAAEWVCINPNTSAVDRIASLLEVPGAVDVMQFFDGAVLVAGFRIGESSDFAGLNVSDMKLLFASTPTLAAAIQRDNRWIVPGGAEQILQGDLVYFVIARHELRDVLSLAGVGPLLHGRIMIAGATSIGLELAQRLEGGDTPVVLLEEDSTLARAAVEVLAKTLVIHGRPTDQSLLEDEEIEQVSTFVAVSEDHESNLVAGLLAKRLGAGRSIVMVDNPAMVAMVGDIGIDAIISERLLTIGSMLQHIRGGGVRSGAALLGDQVEIIEVVAEPGSRITAMPLAQAELPRGVLIAALQRGDHFVFPRGEDTVVAGDRILIVVMNDLVAKLTDYLQT